MTKTVTSRRALMRAQTLLVLTALAAILLGALGTSSAMAAAGWWRITSESAPTNLAPGKEQTITLDLGNLGDATINGTSSPITVVDKLPAGVTPVDVNPPAKNGAEGSCSIAAQVVTCKFPGNINAYEQLPIGLVVKIELPPGTVSAPSQEVTVGGGGVTGVSRAFPLKITEEPTKYGVTSLELASFNEDGSPATQAGSEPFQFTTTFVLNQERQRSPIELPKDFTFDLPPGLVGNPTQVGQCSMTDFIAIVEETNLCPATSVVGVAAIAAHELKVVQKTVPVFNLTPSRGEPARFGFEVLGKIPVVIDTGVKSGQDYGVVVSVKDATQTAGLLSSQVTLWGNPGDPRHNSSRGWECVAGGAYVNQAKKGACPAASTEPETAFLRLPTSCPADPAAEPFVTKMSTDAWTNPGVLLGAEYAWLSDSGQPLGFTGCDQLPFAPSVSVVPSQHTASTPTGLRVDVKVPQESTVTPGQLAEADVRDTTVTLPEGVKLSPSAANGLEACSEGQVGFTGFNAGLGVNEFDTGPVSCPDGSKLGSVKIKTPLLANELTGYVYLASPAPNGEPDRNPFSSLVALYLVVEDPVSGVQVKLAGEGQIAPGTLRVSTTFRNTPQVPFEDLQLELFDGPRASVTTPALCGDYSTDGAFTPWSGASPLAVSSGGDFQVTSGVGGGACPASVPFSPGFLAQSDNPQAGAFTSFTLELSRHDGDQALSGLTMHLPGGLAALLSSVELCSEAQAAASACPTSSEIGQATAIAGLGPNPYVQEGGRVFITGPYKGAPFGIEIVTPAKAGPFDLGFVTVRSTLSIDPHDASVTITSDPLPTQVRGIPLQLKRVLVRIDRPQFQFNGTSCAPSEIKGTLTGDEGAAVPVSSRFNVTGCQNLPFAPKLSASVAGQGSRVNGTTFAVRLESAGLGQANIHKVLLQLPKVLPSRLETLKKACLAATFETNPASCSPESVIGTATIHTPVLKSALSGPAYLVSHGNASFPDVEFVLQGEGITLVVDGQTDIKGGITYSKFETAPDAPFTTFETVLPAGPKSVLSAYDAANTDEPYSVCGTKLTMPTMIVSQSNQVLTSETQIAITGCGAVKNNKTKKLSLRQQYSKALKACRTRYKHNKAKRASCERKVHKAYTVKATAACRKTHKRPGKARKTCETTARKLYAAVAPRHRR